MRVIKQFLHVIFVALFICSCKTAINEDNTIPNSEENVKENINSVKRRMEIKFSCEADGISEYLDDGWIILKEQSVEKICTWKSVPATKGCDMEKDKGCKVTKPDKIGEEKTYLLEK